MARHSTGLFDLPRELRDEIYGYPVAEFYHVPLVTHHFHCPGAAHGSAQESPPTFLVNTLLRWDRSGQEALLQVSPEFASFLYARSTFCFSYPKPHCYERRTEFNVPTPELARQMQRIEFILETSVYRPYRPNRWIMWEKEYSTQVHKLMARETLNKRYKSALKAFTGAGSTRKSFYAIFDLCYDCDHIWIQETSLFKSLALMTSFVTITVALRGEPESFDNSAPPYDPEDSDPGSPWDPEDPDGLGLGEWLCCDLSKNSFGYWELARKHLRQVLEPHLGPGCEYTEDHCRYIEYHPLQHQLLATRDSAAGTGVSSGEITSDLDTILHETSMLKLKRCAD